MAIQAKPPSRWQQIGLFEVPARKWAGYKEVIVDKQLETFCDNATYEGDWDDSGMHGNGIFTMPHGVKHDGTIRHGRFHGSGKLIYPSGALFIGRWEEAHMIAHQYYYRDIKYNSDYLKMPDRRFIKEAKCGIRPAGRSYLTNNYPCRKIPPNCYDSGDGFYNPQTKCVTDYSIPKKIVRIPTKSEHDWIVANCRKAWDEPVGYRPDLYENWDETCNCSCVCPQPYEI